MCVHIYMSDFLNCNILHQVVSEIIWPETAGKGIGAKPRCALRARSTRGFPWDDPFRMVLIWQNITGIEQKNVCLKDWWYNQISDNLSSTNHDISGIKIYWPKKWLICVDLAMTVIFQIAMCKRWPAGSRALSRGMQLQSYHYFMLINIFIYIYTWIICVYL